MLSGPYELLVVLAGVAWLAVVSSGRRQAILQTCTLAVLALVLFRLACSSVSSVWLLCDFVGQALGNGVGWLLGVPLNIGATFAGLDFLVLMAAFYVGWLFATDGPRLVASPGGRLGHSWPFICCTWWSLPTRWIWRPCCLPSRNRRLTTRTYRRRGVGRTRFDNSCLGICRPWRRCFIWRSPVSCSAGRVGPSAPACRRNRHPGRSAGRSRGGRRLIAMGPYLVAAVLPISATLSLARTDLSGRRFVANQVGNLNWDRPQYDRYGQAAAGWFGMLPHLVESLGGEFRDFARPRRRRLVPGQTSYCCCIPRGPWRSR